MGIEEMKKAATRIGSLGGSSSRDGQVPRKDILRKTIIEKMKEIA
jgi:hypothetical protein